MVQEYEPHPFGEIVPPATEEEYAGLRDDIAEHGMNHPITLYEGKVLDGRHRYRACRELGVAPRFVELKGGEREARAYVISQNLQRRHLTEGQRVAFTTRFVTTPREGGRPKREENRNNCAGLFSIEEAAAAAGTSRRPVKEMMRVRDKGAPELAEAVAAAEVAVSDAASVAAKPHAVQRAALETVRATPGKSTLRKEAARIERKVRQEEALSSAPPPDGRVHECACKDLGQHVAPGSLDAIFTDPPYPRELLHCWDERAWLAVEALRPGGLLLAISGQMFLPEVLRRLTVYGLEYRWTAALIWRRPREKYHAAKISSGWKPMLVMGKQGPQPERYSEDAYRAEAYRPETQAGHEWGQDEALMRAVAAEWLTPGWRVCDPFCGAGSLLAAAVGQGCTVVGADVEAAHVAQARRRVEAALAEQAGAS